MIEPKVVFLKITSTKYITSANVHDKKGFEVDTRMLLLNYKLRETLVTRACWAARNSIEIRLICN